MLCAGAYHHTGAILVTVINFIYLHCMLCAITGAMSFLSSLISFTYFTANACVVTGAMLVIIINFIYFSTANALCHHRCHVIFGARGLRFQQVGAAGCVIHAPQPVRAAHKPGELDLQNLYD